MFSRVDILKAMKSGDIKIEPFDGKDLKPAAVVLHLDNEFAIAQGGVLDLLACKDFSEFYKIKMIREGEKVSLRPGAFILGRTLERISLSKDIGMLIDGTTTLARSGITVTQTAMLIHPGHGYPKPRKIVLEMKNDGPFTVKLTVGMPIADGIFFKLQSSSDILYDLKWVYGKKPDSLLPQI